MTTPRPAPAPITPREREVWILVAEDLCDKQIAARLGVGYRTITKHRAALHQKLGTHSPIGLMREAIRQRLVTIEQLQP